MARCCRVMPLYAWTCMGLLVGNVDGTSLADRALRPLLPGWRSFELQPCCRRLLQGPLGTHTVWSFRSRIHVRYEYSASLSLIVSGVPDQYPESPRMYTHT